MKKIITTLLLLLCTFWSYCQVNPHHIPGLAHWYSADSVNIDSNGLIDTIYDLSLNNDHFTQPNPTKRPLFIDSSINDRPVVNFNGSSQFMESMFSQTVSQAYTLFAVWRSSAGGQRVFLDDRVNVMLDNNSGSQVRIFAGAAVAYNKANPFDYIITHAQFNGGSSKLYENNTLKAQGNVGSNNLPGLTMGKRTIYNDRFFSGDFSQVLIYEGVLTQNQIDSVYTYLLTYHTKPVEIETTALSYSLCETTLYAGERFTSYLWSDGSTADSLLTNGTGTYWVETVDIFGFTSRDTIKVQPGFNYPSSTVYCPNGEVTWQTGLLYQDYTYIWSDGSTADSLNISSAGDYYVQATDTAGCTQYSDTLHFTEDTFQMQVSLGSDTSLCAGNVIGLETGSSQTTSYLWNTGESSPAIVVSTSGNYSLIAQNANGCEAKDTIQINVIGNAPTVDFNIPLVVCTGVPVPFQDLTFTTDGSTIDSLHWSFGNSTLTNVSQGNFTFDTVNSYPVTLYARTSTGCSQTLTKIVHVNLSPVVNFVSQYSCENQIINFMGSQATSTFIPTWKWNFDDPTSGSTNFFNGPTTGRKFSTYGNFNVQLIATDLNGCSDTVVLVKNIKPAPKPNFSFEEICTGETTQFTNLSSNPAGNTITSYTWNFGNGSNSQSLNPSATYVFPGNYNVQLSVTSSNGCSKDTSMVFRVHDLPVVQQTVTNNCAGLNAQFTDASTVNDGTLDQITWQFNDGTVLNGNTVLHSYTNEGLFPVIQTVTSSFGCTNSKNQNVLINSRLKAGFTIATEELVTSYPIQFNSTSIGATNYQWSFGNFASSQQADTTLIFPDVWIDSTINIQLVVSNSFGCSDTSSSVSKIKRSKTDLALTKIIYQDFNGYTKMGVHLKNEGTVPITNVLLKVNKTGIGIYQEAWTGTLLSGQSTVYVFQSMPLTAIPDKDSIKNYICIEGKILQPSQFPEVSLNNNQICEAISIEEAIIMDPYPNPVSNELTLKIIVPQDIQGKIEIVDAIGKLVYSTQEILFTKGLNEIGINTSDWAKGSYRIVWKGSNKLPSIGFVKN